MSADDQDFLDLAVSLPESGFFNLLEQYPGAFFTIPLALLTDEGERDEQHAEDELAQGAASRDAGQEEADERRPGSSICSSSIRGRSSPFRSRC
jgi:hypothetical protein